MKMFGYESWCSYGWWASCFFVMIVMMGLCFFFMMYMMKRLKGNMMYCLPLFRKAEGIDYSASESARDILDKRYASGEISSEEYEEKKKILNQT